MTSKKQTILSLVLPAIIAIIPAGLTYCQSMYEIRQKYTQSHIEAEAGYTTLVASVKELQEATKEQHDQIIKIQAYLQAMEQLMTRTASTTRTPSTYSGGSRSLTSPDMGLALARIRPTAAPAPELTEPAPNLSQAAEAKR